MKIVVKINEKVPPSKVVEKIMAPKRALQEALTNGTLKEFAQSNSGKRKTLSAHG